MSIHWAVSPLSLTEHQGHHRLCFHDSSSSIERELTHVIRYQSTFYRHEMASLSRLSIVLSICTNRLQKKHSATATEAGLTAPVVLVIEEGELHPYRTTIQRYSRNKSILLLFRNIREKRPTKKYPKSTNSFGNSTPRSTFSDTSTHGIRTYPWRG